MAAKVAELIVALLDNASFPAVSKSIIEEMSTSDEGLVSTFFATLYFRYTKSHKEFGDYLNSLDRTTTNTRVHTSISLILHKNE